MTLSDREIRCIEVYGRLYVPDEIVNYHLNIRDILRDIREAEEDVLWDYNTEEESDDEEQSTKGPEEL